jgi:hypothetical protein
MGNPRDRDSFSYKQPRRFAFRSSTCGVVYVTWADREMWAVLPEVTSVPATGKSYGLVTNTCETLQQRIIKCFEFEIFAEIDVSDFMLFVPYIFLIIQNRVPTNVHSLLRVI